MHVCLGGGGEASGEREFVSASVLALGLAGRAPAGPRLTWHSFTALHLSWWTRTKVLSGFSAASAAQCKASSLQAPHLGEKNWTTTSLPLALATVREGGEEERVRVGRRGRGGSERGRREGGKRNADRPRVAW